MKDMCRTRWIQRIDALHNFKSIHPSIVACMRSTDSVTDARSLMLAITSSDFISALVITSQSLGYLKALTCSLQAEAKDIVTAVGEIDTVVSTLQDVTDNITAYHEEW